MMPRACLWWAFCLCPITLLVKCETPEEWRTRIDAKIDRVRKADGEIRDYFIGIANKRVNLRFKNQLL
jgi:hypothetical protein